MEKANAAASNRCFMLYKTFSFIEAAVHTAEISCRLGPKDVEIVHILQKPNCPPVVPYTAQTAHVLLLWGKLISHLSALHLALLASNSGCLTWTPNTHKNTDSIGSQAH